VSGVIAHSLLDECRAWLIPANGNATIDDMRREMSPIARRNAAIGSSGTITRG
jgi:hypothetical protein